MRQRSAAARAATGKRAGRGTAKPKKDDVWRALAARANGSLTLGWSGRVKAVQFAANDDTFVLDTAQEGSSSSVCTRFRVLYNARDDLRFRVTRKTIFSGLPRFFGVPSLRIGHPDVDAGWVVRGNSEGKIRSILIQPDMVRALVQLRQGNLTATRYRKRAAPANTRILTIEIPGECREPDRLDAGLFLITTTLAQLRRIGSAHPAPVTMALR